MCARAVRSICALASRAAAHEACCKHAAWLQWATSRPRAHARCPRSMRARSASDQTTFVAVPCCICKVSSACRKAPNGRRRARGAAAHAWIRRQVQIELARPTEERASVVMVSRDGPRLSSASPQPRQPRAPRALRSTFGAPVRRLQHMGPAARPRRGPPATASRRAAVRWRTQARLGRDPHPRTAGRCSADDSAHAPEPDERELAELDRRADE